MKQCYICKGQIYVFSAKDSFVQDTRHNNIMTCWSQPIPTVQLNTDNILAGLRHAFPTA